MTIHNPEIVDVISWQPETTKTENFTPWKTPSATNYQSKTK